MRQIADGLRVKADGALRRAEIVLRPASLGQVRVEMEMEGDRLRLRLIADRPEVQAAAKAQESQLRSSLMAQGLQIDDITIDTAPERTGAEGQSQGQRWAGSEGRSPRRQPRRGGWTEGKIAAQAIPTGRLSVKA